MNGEREEKLRRKTKNERKRKKEEGRKNSSIIDYLWPYCRAVIMRWEY
jgi:hypothetical protein